MLIHITFFCLLFTQILTDQSIDPSIKPCPCNLNPNLCDFSCCCDVDCSPQELKSFNCHNLENDGNAKRTISKMGTKSTCFKNLPIYTFNGPYTIEQNGDLICVNTEENTDDAFYQNQINQKLDSFTFARSINVDAGTSSPLGTPSELTGYQLGTSIFRFIASSNSTNYYGLPVKLFNSQLCSGLQTIRYMNDFSSTCNQPVTSSTCLDELNAEKYVNSFCLVKNPSTLGTGSVSYVCCSGTGNTAQWSGTECSNVLQSVQLRIYYTNPNGIDSCDLTVSVSAPPTTTPVPQTFTVQFLRTGYTASTLPARSGNPGYLVRAPIIAGTLSGSTISTSAFTVLRSTSSGDCTGTTSRVPVRFGENIQSTCQLTPTGTCPSQSDLTSIFLSFTSTDVRVAAYANPNTANVATDWVTVRYCIYDVGSSNDPTCGPGSVPNPTANECYTRMDIQIAYANIGAVGNPQPVIGAVVFYYQRINITSTTTLPPPFLMTQTVTFQDISALPVTEGDHLPNPNVRLPGDFFYPLTLNRATNSNSFSWYFNLLIMFVFILM